METAVQCTIVRSSPLVWGRSALISICVFTPAQILSNTRTHYSAQDGRFQGTSPQDARVRTGRACCWQRRQHLVHSEFQRVCRKA
jgi:hypothetical protein